MSETERTALIARLAALETAGMSDVLDEMGFSNQVLSSGIRPLDPSMRMAGVALCVRGENRVVTQSVPSAAVSISPTTSGHAPRVTATNCALSG